VGEPLRVLILEDRPADAELLVYELRRGGFDPHWERVETEPEYLAHLDPALDLILADFSLPGFDAMRALELLKDRGLDIPFIVATGPYEERGVECMKQGAADCLVKDRLARLPEAVRQTLRMKKDRDESRRMAAALRESEERFRLIFEAAPMAIMTVNQEGCIVLVNSQTEKTFGYTRDELIGKSVDMLVPVRFRKRQVKDRAGFFAAPKPRNLGAGRDLFGLCKNGSEIPVEIGLNSIHTEEGMMTLTFVVDVTERRRDEEDLREIAAAAKVANESFRDVNEELRLRNVELDEFTFIASHDLQEPLRKLIAFGDLLPKDLGEVLPEAAGKDLDFITDAARRMRVLVQDLLTLSRAGRAAITRKRISLESCADRALKDVDAEIERTGAEITRDELPNVLGDPTLLTQLYQNLIGNALKFAEPSRRPEIHLTCERKEDQWIFGVRDNGIGIKPEYHQQIFAPFKRLHGRGEYEGTGIGLAICRKAVERHGGRIWVESELGKGAYFKFSLSIESESAACLSERESRPSSSSLRMIPAIKS
jgi:PAS domain S-box-containing protein